MQQSAAGVAGTAGSESNNRVQVIEEWNYWEKEVVFLGVSRVAMEGQTLILSGLGSGREGHGCELLGKAQR